MADIDMIPRSYRDGLRAQRALRSYSLALAALLVGGAAAAGLLHWRLAVDTPRLEQLRTRTAEAEALRARLNATIVRKNALDQDAKALSALRGTGSIARLALALDGALNDRVWFDTLHYSRTEELLKAPLPSPLPSGTLETRASLQPNAVPGPQTWLLSRHVEIGGQAMDHAALSAFLAALSTNPVLADVRFLKSSATPGEGPEPVAFSVTGALAPTAGKP